MRRIKSFVLLEVIGRGSYSTVFRCININEDVSKYYACKVYKRKDMNQRMIKNLHEEIAALKKFTGSPKSNVSIFVAVFKTKRHFYTIIDYCNGGDLDSLMSFGLKLTERQVQYIFREVLVAVKELQEKNIIHRDIKNANILLHLK